MRHRRERQQKQSPLSLARFIERHHRDLFFHADATGELRAFRKAFSVVARTFGGTHILDVSPFLFGQLVLHHVILRRQRTLVSQSTDMAKIHVSIGVLAELSAKEPTVAKFVENLFGTQEDISSTRFRVTFDVLTLYRIQELISHQQRSNTFDTVIAGNLFSLIPNEERRASACALAGSLRQGGKLIMLELVTTPFDPTKPSVMPFLPSRFIGKTLSRKLVGYTHPIEIEELHRHILSRPWDSGGAGLKMLIPDPLGGDPRTLFREGETIFHVSEDAAVIVIVYTRDRVEI